MRFYDSCTERITWDDVIEDMVDDLDFEMYLSELIELRKLEKAIAAEEEEDVCGKTPCNC